MLRRIQWSRLYNLSDAANAKSVSSWKYVEYPIYEVKRIRPPDGYYAAGTQSCRRECIIVYAYSTIWNFDR